MTELFKLSDNVPHGFDLTFAALSGYAAAIHRVEAKRHGPVVLHLDFGAGNERVFHTQVGGEPRVHEGAPPGEGILLRAHVNAEALRRGLERGLRIQPLLMATGMRVRGDVAFIQALAIELNRSHNARKGQ